MTNVRNKIDPFTHRDATLRLSGHGATLGVVVNPSSKELEVLGALDLHDLKATPLRTGTSDIVVRERTTLAAQYGVDATLAHYARHGGEIEIDGTKARVTGWERGMLSYEIDGAQHLLQLAGSNKGIKFGKVEPAFEERKAPTVRFELEKFRGVDALHISGAVDAMTDVSYALTIVDASNEDAIKAEFQSFATIANHAQRNIENVNVEIVLNPASPMMRGGGMRSHGVALESAPAAARVGDVVEGAASHVKTMPIRAGNVSLRSGETQFLNITGAVNGNPNSKAAYIPMTLKQKNSVVLEAYPGTIDESVTQKQTAQSSFEQGATKGPQPAGMYTIYDGKDVAGQTRTHAYTEKGKKVTIPGIASGIEAEAKTTTKSQSATEWTPVADSTPMLPRVRQPAGMDERTVTERMEQEIVFTSSSAFLRTVDVTLNAAAFTKGVQNLKVRVGGRIVDATFDKDARTISFRAPVPANGKAKASISFDGLRIEERQRPADA